MMVERLFDLLYDKDFYTFERCVRDKYPFQIVKEEGKTVITHNVLGLGSEDINIEIEPKDDRFSYIVIKGLSSDEKYSVNSRFTVKHSDIENIEKECDNGILTLTINWKKVEAPKIEIISKE